MQFQMMPYRLRLLIRFRDEVDLDLHLKFPPPGFRDFERRGFNDAEGVGVRFVQLEGDFLDEVGEVGVGGAGFDVEGPLVGVVGVYVSGAGGRVDGLGDGAEDYFVI